MKKYDVETLKVAQEEIATGDRLDPTVYPRMGNLSARHFFRFVPCPLKKKRPEFIYIPLDFEKETRDATLKKQLFITDWNLLWEAGHLRPDFFNEKIPAGLSWVEKYRNKNIYLLPDTGMPRYEAYVPLFHLLPQAILRQFNLPLFKAALWPPAMHHHLREPFIKSNFEDQLSKAFSCYIWPLLNSSSKRRAFSKDDPLVTLSHNLDYWLPFIYAVAEKRLKAFSRTELESTKDAKDLEKLRKQYPKYIRANTPLCGGTLWEGEEEAREVASEMVDIADRNGKLRAIIDAIKSNRVEDDFSSLWSYEKEDFERKLYSKRSKVKVSFVELDDTVPVHGRWSELHDNLLWEDFISILDPKERRVVICLRNGITKLAEIGKLLGYANHSPVSKALKQVRKKAAKYLFQ